MGEILRAVMDEAAIFKLPSFYAISIPIPNPVPPTGTFLTGFLQAKNDRWFLITSLFASLVNGANGTTSNFLNSTRCNLFDVTSTMNYWSSAGNPTNLGGPVNSAFTLPEYILLAPDQMIGFRVDLDGIAVAPGVDIIRLQMQGIEYTMPGT